MPLYQQLDLYGANKRLNWKARSDELIKAYDMSLKEGSRRAGATSNGGDRGRNSVAECQLPKLDVAGSNPVGRSNGKGLRVTP